jgi:hypothetical protein
MPDQISTESDTDPIASTSLADREEAHDLVNPMAESLSRIADRAERAREKNPPSVLDLTPINGAIPTIATHVRMRVIEIVLSSCVVDVLVLMVGGIQYVFNVDVGLNCFPFPIEIDRGVDCTLVSVAGSVCNSCYIFYYSE